MVYDDKKIIYFCKEALLLLKSYGYPNSKIIIGDSLDKNGIPDTPETIKYKESIEHLYNGKFLWEVSMKKKPYHLFIIEEESKDFWNDKWDNPYREIVSVRGTDKYDYTTMFRGNGYLWIKDGIMSLSGSQPRMYVGVDLQDVDVSVDFKRIGTDGLGWSGGNIGVRSHPEGHAKSPEKAHTYYFRLKHGQQLDFYKEEQHGQNKTGVIKSIKYKWNTETWYNMRFKCYNLNLTDNQVKLEGYINGKLELEYTDTDEVMYNGRGIVFLRNTSIEEAQYKNLKINMI